MAAIIPEPIDNNPLTEDWQKLLFKLTATTAGLNLLDIDKTNLRVKTGSRIEVNGSFYRASSDESINGFTAIPNRTFFWLYANPGTNVITFDSSQIIPTWQVQKGGWFNNTNGRAIAYCYKSLAGALYEWVPAFDYEIKYERCMPPLADYASVSGLSTTFSQSVKGLWNTSLVAGWYFAELASGLGGGNGATGGQPTGGGGGVAAVSKTLRLLFFHDGKKQVNVKIGGSGFNGGAGGNGITQGSIYNQGGGGGGSGAGEETTINGKTTGRQPGGNGGNGGSRTSNYGAGGGGGGGVIGGNGGNGYYGAALVGAGGGGGGMASNGTNGGWLNTSAVGGAGGTDANNIIGNGIGNGGNGGGFAETGSTSYNHGGGGGASNNPRSTAGNALRNTANTYGAGNGGAVNSNGQNATYVTNQPSGGGGGGGQGYDGDMRKDGQPGGYCRIYKVGDIAA